ncbi:unnamed protein product [Rotaria socialis]|uniref:Uncharacterized protein n=1 Tax=Rotaria socialis TaxID=392032 RepID=A0A821CGX9_9BILA|nr:unnamed protein product [Rotaria socialis]CAF4606133.1 unnamed protein product [Rotaria socialis]
MANFSIEIDSDSQFSYPTVLPGVRRRLDDELDANGIPWMRVSREGYLPIDPIQDVKAQNVMDIRETGEFIQNIPSNRYKKLKPLWLYAEIWEHHVGRGEVTNVSDSLSNLIKGRGIYDNRNSRNSGNDDCGHIVAASLGGKMVDINLFPQNQCLNRGWKDNYSIWRLIEACIKLWVTGIPEKYRPRVKFQMLLYYNNPKYPDRPDQFKYMVQFLMDDDSSSDEDNDDDEKIYLSHVLYNIAEISLQCRNKEAETLKARIKTMIVQMSYRCKANVAEFLRELSEIIPKIEHPRSQPFSGTPTVSPTPVRDRKISVWDFVPVLGSVKTIAEGCEDVADGNVGSAAANFIIGSISLGLDVLTVGSCSTAMRGIGKMVAKETAKGAARTATTKLIEKTGEAAVKTVASYTASSVLKAANSDSQS